MKKLFKYLFIAMSVLILLLVMIGVAAYFLIDDAMIKDKISKAVKEQTGRDFLIKGEIKKSFYPVLGVNVEGIEILNPDGFKNRVFLSLKKIDMGVKIMPLFDGKVYANRIYIDGLVVNLEKNHKGDINWAFDVDESSGGNQNADFKFEGIEVSDSRITYLNMENNQDITVDNIFLQIGIESFIKPINIEFSADVDSKNPQQKSNLNLKFTAQVLPGFLGGKISDFDVNIKSQSPEFPTGKMDFSLSGDIELNNLKQTMSVKDFAMNLMGVSMGGDIFVSDFGGEPKLNAKIKVYDFSPKGVATDFGIALPEFKDEVFNRIKLDLNIFATKDFIKLNKMSIELDEIKINGDAEIKNPTDPYVYFALNVDQINLDNYMPITEEKQNEKSVTGIDLNFALLRKLNLNGVLDIGYVLFNKIETKDLKVEVKADNGVIDILQNKISPKIK